MKCLGSETDSAGTRQQPLVLPPGCKVMPAFWVLYLALKSPVSAESEAQRETVRAVGSPETPSPNPSCASLAERSQE